eukprot:TRINITY_DN4069_c0_g1_i1.p1 TRINITY_DN4069_c0_g1~~TRINITY_DN4069_c0_g1_i1.p1  ORF type:complete len:447 (-),score=58.73 TRINITY_DN4069_c0_g1_i1:336-1676(-)
MSCRSFLYSLFGLVALLVALLAGWIAAQPCSDWHEEVCALVLDYSLCSLVPSLSSRFCGKSCGWCIKGTEQFRPTPVRALRPWRAIDRLPSNTTLEHFEKHYKATHTPVIFENWLNHSAPTLTSWTLEKIVRVCGKKQVGFAERREHFLIELLGLVGQGLLKQVVDMYTKISLNTTIAECLGQARQKLSFEEVIQHLDEAGRKRAEAGNPEPDYRSLLEYLLSSRSVNDFSLKGLCPELWNDAVLPRWATPTFPISQGCSDRRIAASVFVEADGARAYPAHQHGNDLTHGFQVLLAGAKKVVLWPYKERKKLYPILTTLTTESGDEVFAAEGIHHNFDRFPSMADTDGWEGQLETGDLLFVPAVGVHVFESVGTSLGLRFMNADESSLKFGKELLRAGSPAVDPDFLDTFKELSSKSGAKARSAGDSTAAVKEILLKDLAKELGCI